MAELRRFPDWPERLAAAVEKARTAEFRWGEHDCCLFAADVVHALTGHDYAASFRGRYDDGAGAAVLIASHGSLQALIEAVIGDPIPPSRARRGDVVLGTAPTPAGEEDAIGICIGRLWAAPGQAGLRFLQMSICRAAWRIG